MGYEMIFTSESVTAGHPDKLCDQISDAAVDAFLRGDPGARIIIECAVATGIVFLAARFSSLTVVDLPMLARIVIEDAGYLGGQFDAKQCSILTSLNEMPRTMRELPMDGSDDADLFPAQDQANAFGYACRETPELMPLPIVLAHKLARGLDDLRRTGNNWLAPDGKTQVSVEYDNDRPKRIHTISLNTGVTESGRADLSGEQLNALISGAFVDEEFRPDSDTNIHIHAGAPYEGGGPARHAGLTGRKNGVDTYGEIARQSGAALSGKDPSRIDRVGAYAARHAAKNVIAAGLAERCEVHLAYEIGQARPISISVETFGTGTVSDDTIARRLENHLDFRPPAITRRFGLRSRPARLGNQGFYQPLATYGHFGRAELDLPWEALDAVEALRG
ncbi:MAG: methionine adenosyltransferase [Methyloceanibacter sp.]|jgi:S-adenosylmethionine synthetase